MSRSPRALARELLRAAGRNPLWRAWGRRRVVPEIEIIRAGEDPLQRWRDVYPDFRGRRGLTRTLEHTWLAVRGRRALGGLMLHPYEGALLLHTMRVRLPWRGLGIGRRLLEEALRHADGAGREVWLQVRRDNRPAIGLYRSTGFADAAGRPALRREEHLTLRRPIGGGSVLDD